MTLIEALEKHVPGAKEIVKEIAPGQMDTVQWKASGADFLCSFGLSASLYAMAREWLDEDDKRRLVFIEERAEALARLLEEPDAILLLNDFRVKIYFIETPLQLEIVAKKIAWSAVFLKMELLNISHSPHFDALKQSVETVHLAANLLLSDASDWGCKAVKHKKVNLREPYKSALELKGAFNTIPAIIVGAGPSLEKNGHLLEKLRSKALIFAGGNAIRLISCPPHFAGAIDKDEPLKGYPFPDVPLLFQARMHPDNRKLAKTGLLVPDAHHAFLNHEPLFDAGWTVGNFLTSLAIHFGCSPIVFVGMDYCYAGSQKYANGSDADTKGLIQALSKAGETVWTQTDWLMAIRWTEEKSIFHSLINATEGGLGFGGAVAEAPLESLTWDEIPDLDERVQEAIQKLPFCKAPNEGIWKESLKRAQTECEKRLRGEVDSLEQESVFSELLLPLWRIWSPVFERTLDLDLHKMAKEKKMTLNETLFYAQVIQEHLDAIQ